MGKEMCRCCGVIFDWWLSRSNADGRPCEVIVFFFFNSFYPHPIISFSFRIAWNSRHLYFEVIALPGWSFHWRALAVCKLKLRAERSREVMPFVDIQQVHAAVRKPFLRFLLPV